MQPLELWGGVECTVNRVGSRFFDQVRRTGHHDRPDDISLLASTGISAVRYPVLWERVAPGKLTEADWSWTDDRLARLRDHGVAPIAGLVHHGSGPAFTSLVDPRFPELLAAYARAVAERYPWVDRYTPVNEPLTTARFSGLYGHWYPHGRTRREFVAALLNQVRGTMLAMQAVREVNPAASLIQTEDAGRTDSTPMLAYQAAQDNHRRWLTIDLLAGRVVDTHPLWSWLLKAGASPTQLDWMAEHPCPPDVIGLNYYLTSDRYLDESLEFYPVWSHGGNGRHRYADIEAVRAHSGTFAGHERILTEAWDRYGLPVALTEVHAGGSREDQMRWLARAWQGAERARQAGASVPAITLWSMFGSVDWNSLCVQCNDVYEGGVFDVRSNPPRPTALGRVARALATGGELEPLAHQPGWWERPERLHWGRPVRRKLTHDAPQAPILIAGGYGILGLAFAAACAERALPHAALGRQDLDVTDPASIQAAIERWRPWAIVNAAGYGRVDDAERDPDACLELNADAPAALATACAGSGIRLVTFSCDLVFDGQLRRPYVETDTPHPLNVYGIAKLVGEARVRDILPEALIVRTSALFGPPSPDSFISGILRDLAEGRTCRAADDALTSPTYVPDLAHATLELLIDHAQGLWHLANRGEITWLGLARLAAERAGLSPDRVRPIAPGQLQLAAPRPAYSALGSSRGVLLPSLESAVGRYIETAGTRVTQRQLG